VSCTEYSVSDTEYSVSDTIYGVSIMGRGPRSRQVQRRLRAAFDLIQFALELVALQVSKVDVRLPGKENSNSHGARPVHLIITTIKRLWTSRLSMKNSLSLSRASIAARCSAACTLRLISPSSRSFDLIQVALRSFDLIQFDSLV